METKEIIVKPREGYIKIIEATGTSISVYKQEAYNEKIKTMFLNSKAMGIGADGALVFEIQKLLKSKGHDIPVDGMFKQITIDALKAFEAKHKLFADGTLDLLTPQRPVGISNRSRIHARRQAARQRYWSPLLLQHRTSS